LSLASLRRVSGYAAPPTLSALAGATAAAATFSFYMVGAERSYDYGSSESVGAFIATRSLLDPFRRQFQFNNHPLFSFLEHLVFSAGGVSETALRALPEAAAATTVARRLARRSMGMALWGRGRARAGNESDLR
jgi:hypothetical protein